MDTFFENIDEGFSMGPSVRILPVFFLQNFGLSPHDPLGQIQAVGTFDVFLEFLLHSRKILKQTLDFLGEAKRKELIADYEERFSNPYVAANRGYLDDVIDPIDTRPKIIAALKMLRNKTDSMPAKKHGNIPL